MTPRLQTACFHLLRHGAPARAGLLLGRTDLPSSPEGIAACRERARALTFCHVVSSDLSRACAAARAIAQDCGAAHTIDPRWRELDFGAWDGLAPDAIAPDALGRFWSDPEGHAPPQGERWSQLTTRVGAALAALPLRDTLIVTHAGAMRAALATLLGLDVRQVWGFDLPYAARLSLRVWDETGDGARGAQITGLQA
ncbi:histidine phosphatase family protein [Novosphingobium sp. 1949]|uniref:Histidine phosphatase family protein n=1 Tax=Novosphingobium organovorum TaxID=2930092 RepID=A0ABT0BGT7_9SPHN|nr:histidine phosphatase family protein [Novosphingobium organovorum]MCJ2183974.1 histidine phosphatase family protein [Novosphingobium organovorum]